MEIPEPRKLSFDEAWETTTEFFVDDSIENEIDKKISEVSYEAEVSGAKISNIYEFTKLIKEENGLDISLADISLSQEKFKRIVSLMRRKGIVTGGFDRECDTRRIKRQIQEDDIFAHEIARILFEGKEDPFLVQYLPKYYREKLNWKEVGQESRERRKLKIKESLYRKIYANIKGNKIEQLIGEKLQAIKSKYGVNYGRGRSRIVDVDVDWAIPSAEDLWVIVMVSYQETTSSGQSTKARDMLSAYNRIRTSNSRNRENRAFVNFIDGIGWLARRNDFQRLVEECHYFLNLKNLDMMEGIVLKHVPR